jgi:hypothetical protein
MRDTALKVYTCFIRAQRMPRPVMISTPSLIPLGSQRGISDTSELMYLGGDNWLECPAFFVPVLMRETGQKGAEDGEGKEAYA